MIKKVLIISASLWFLMIGIACATMLTSKINMDNIFSLYISTDDTSAGTYIGGGSDWTTTITNTVELNSGTDYYLHVYGHDTGWIAGFLGEFTLSGSDHVFVNGSTSLLTNTTDWNANLTGWGDSYLSSLTDLGKNGVWPWYSISGVDSDAHWIWGGSAYYDDTTYFSTKIMAVTNPVPEPGTLFLLGFGIAGIGIIKFRKNILKLR